MRLFPLLVAGLVLVSAFIKTEPRETLHYIAFKQTDSLTGYLNHTFDAIDNNPLLAYKADSLFSNIWRKPKNFEEKLAYYQLIINTAYHLLQMGQTATSTKWYEEAFSFYQNNYIDNPQLQQEMDFEEYVCKPLGNNYTRMGDFTKAVYVQTTAVNAALKNGKTQMLPSLYANLATTYFNLEEYDTVQHIANVGIAKTQQTGDISILLYNIKTEAFIETKHIDSAVKWNRKALDINFLSSEARNWHVTSLMNKAKIESFKKHFQNSVRYLNMAWKIAETSPVRLKAKIANEIGVAFVNHNQLTLGRHWYQTALGFFNVDSTGLYPDFTYTTSLFGLAEIFEKENMVDSACYRYELAVVNDYYTQQLIGISLFSKSSIYYNNTATEKAITLYHRQYEITDNKEFLLKALWLTELSKGRKLMIEQQRTSRWQTGTSTHVNRIAFEKLRNDYVKLAESDPPGKAVILQRIQEQEYELSLHEKQFSRLLQPPSFKYFSKWVGEASKLNCLLSYYCGNNKNFIIKVDRGNISHVIFPVGERTVQIGNFLKTYFYNGPAAFNNDPEEYYKTAYAIFITWVPVNSSSNNKFIISPDDIFHQLPFEALTTNPSQPLFLGAKSSITYSLSFLHASESAVLQKVGVDIFSFDKQHHLGFTALPAIQEEVRFLQKNFESILHAADTCSTNTFIEALSTGNIVHVASHAVAADSIAQPYIVLKEKLYLGQLQYLTARSPLVVLAACETGYGTLLKNEGMLSLSRSFLSKGVSGVISTKWQADDATASAIIRSFYKHLEADKNPSIALQKARLDYLNGKTNIADLNPWLWACFYYQGKLQTLQLQPTPHFNTTLLVISGIGIIVTILFFYIIIKRYCRKLPG